MTVTTHPNVIRLIGLLTILSCRFSLVTTPRVDAQNVVLGAKRIFQPAIILA